MDLKKLICLLFLKIQSKFILKSESEKQISISAKTVNLPLVSSSSKTLTIFRPTVQFYEVTLSPQLLKQK